MSLDTSSGAPEWLFTALDSALVNIGATADEQTRREEVELLVSAWNMGGRSFHNAKYLSSVLEHLDSLEAAAIDPDMLRIAFAYRGAEKEVGWEDCGIGCHPATVPQVCDVDRLLRLGVPPQTVERIHDLVDQLSEHSPKNNDLDAKIIIDADMAVMAAPPQRYRQLIEGLRNEVPFLNSEDFLKRRKRAIMRLLGRRYIFFSPVGRRWDEIARENLEAELSSIEARLSSDDEEVEPLPKDEEPDQVVVRTSIRPALGRANVGVVSLDTPSAGASTVAVEEDSPTRTLTDKEAGADREDDLVSTSTLEMLPDIFDTIRRKRN